MILEKDDLLRWTKDDRNKFVAFLSKFIQIRNPKPLGNTRAMAIFICRFLNDHNLRYRVIVSKSEMHNISLESSTIIILAGTSSQWPY